MTGGICLDDHNLFFPDGYTSKYRVQIEHARAICRECPLFADGSCLETVLALPTAADKVGIYAATTPAERKLERQARKAKAAEVAELPVAPALTGRQREVLRLAHLGYLSTQIAGRMQVHERTVQRELQILRDGGHLEDLRVPTSTWDDCGTTAARRRHAQRGETPCDPCRATDRARRARRTRTAVAA